MRPNLLNCLQLQFLGSERNKGSCSRVDRCLLLRCLTLLGVANIGILDIILTRTSHTQRTCLIIIVFPHNTVIPSHHFVYCYISIPLIPLEPLRQHHGSISIRSHNLLVSFHKLRVCIQANDPLTFSRPAECRHQQTCSRQPRYVWRIKCNSRSQGPTCHL